jgi:transposase-like protein
MRPSFPRSLPEFVRQFRTDEACFRFVVSSRWPDGFSCPKCAHDKGYDRADRWGQECAACGYVVSATAGTVMHRSKQPIRSWLLAAYLVATDKRGISACQLQRQLGLSRYETAFLMLHKLRAAMVNPDRDLLAGRVEVDESYLAGEGRRKSGSPSDRRLQVVGAVEVREGTSAKTGEIVARPGRVRFRSIKNAIQPVLLGFIKDTIKPGSAVVTDGLGSYKVLPDLGYEHEVQMHTYQRPQSEVLKHFHLAVSNLKTWLAGTHHGAVREMHIQAYLNEFAFRFNRRDNLFAAFQTLLGLAPKVEGLPGAALYASGAERSVHAS